MPKGRHDNDATLLFNLIVISKEFNKFPRDGGLLDQDTLFVYLLNHYMMWQSQREELEGRKQNRAVQHH